MDRLRVTAKSRRVTSSESEWRSILDLFSPLTVCRVDDMLEILFPWMFETEIEYLFPDDEDVNGSLMDLDDVDSDDEGDFIDEDGQPLAGPSRT